MDRPQAKDVRLGLPASIDTRNGLVEGRVSRVDPVRLGRSSVNTIEIVGGLEPGDRVILSDTRGGTTAIASG
jgi:HlyD family secretion protein